MRIPVNHEAWIELEDGIVAVYWGHFPRVDGMLETHTIVDAFACRGSSCRPVLLGRGKCRRGECLSTELSGDASSVGVVYERVIVKAGGRWYSGFASRDAIAAGLSVEDCRRVFGFARACRGVDCGTPWGQPLEAVYSSGVLRVVSFGEPTVAEVKALRDDGSLVFEGLCRGECRLGEQPYVVVVKRRVSTVSSLYTGYSLVATLTLS